MPKVLLLNASFEPLRVVSWQRAIVLVFQGKVDILEEYAQVIRTVSREYRLPAVIRLKQWVNLSRFQSVVKFSRSNIYLRDHYCCQYCGGKFQEKDLTLDHVIPVVRGGRKTWENIVTACMSCNQKKAHRTPEEAGMKLGSVPKKPNWLGGVIANLVDTPPSLWLPYLNLEKIAVESDTKHLNLT